GSRTEILGNLNKGDFTIANFETGSGATSTGAQTQVSGGGGTRIGGPGLGIAVRTAPSAPQPREGNSASEGTITSPFTAPEARELTVQIDYTDTTGKRQSATKKVQLSNSGIQSVVAEGNFQRQDAGIFGFLPWALMLIVVAGAVAFNHFRAKKNWKQTAAVLAFVALAFIVANVFFASNIVATGIVLAASVAGLAWYFLKFKGNLPGFGGK
ncbi:MAG: hypothetical protein NUV67_02645, partial [archaeon]|nr:hypothetical protein [archaeon]